MEVNTGTELQPFSSRFNSEQDCMEALIAMIFPRGGASLDDLLWSAQAKSRLKRGQSKHPKPMDDTDGWKDVMFLCIT
ncbi:hypothetical protein BK140_02675 [Paenibacillus macerans]|nr:hypothetical protein BK140_02675 [Paenibacillus macerans]